MTRILRFERDKKEEKSGDWQNVEQQGVVLANSFADLPNNFYSKYNGFSLTSEKGML